MASGKMIPPELIDDIKQRNEIVTVVEKYVHLIKKSSMNLFGLCPFHSEDTPSFSVSPSKQIYYCFGCHKGGDVVHFVMEIEKLGYYDALRMLAEKSGIVLPESDDREYRKKALLQKNIIEINTEAARFYYSNLIGPNGKAGRDYLIKRGIESATIRKFGLGYAPGDWESLYKHLRSKNYSDDVIFLTGLFKKSEKPNNYNNPMYDLFRDRLIFPIFDYMGRVVAFGGRVLDDSVPKYINSPETTVYVKGKHLYGFNIAKHSKLKKLLVVEGYMDTIAIHQAGIDYAVASLGTALTEQQAMIIRNYSDEVVISYDGDLAGQAATMRGLDILKRKGCKVSVLVLPDAKDPDEYIRKHGAQRFRAQIDDALPLMDYKLLRAYTMSQKSAKLDKLTYQEMACDILASEENIVLRELYASKVAEFLGVSPDNVLAETKRRTGNAAKLNIKNSSYGTSKSEINKKSGENDEDNESELSYATDDEIKLLSLLTYAPSVFRTILPEFDAEFFSKGIMKKIAEESIQLGKEGKLTSTALLALGADSIVNGVKLADLFASSCMITGEIASSKEAETEAMRLYLTMRINILLKEKESANESVMNVETGVVAKENLRQRIRDISNEIYLLKSRKEQL